jgi:hypothetical protein
MVLELAREPRIVRVEVNEKHLVTHLEDGRILLVPLDWYPRLAHGTPSEWARYELSGRGYGVHWPDLDEDISVEGLLGGRRSGESEGSFQRWLAARSKR